MPQAAFSGTVWWRRPRSASARSERHRMVRKGNPHVRLAKPGLTASWNDSQRKPSTFTKKLRLDRTASR
jgi:hypothetical protein